jgi:hypothetical protein
MTQQRYIKAEALRKCRHGNTSANFMTPYELDTRTLRNSPLGDQLRGEGQIPRPTRNDAPGTRLTVEFRLLFLARDLDKHPT